MVMGKIERQYRRLNHESIQHYIKVAEISLDTKVKGVQCYGMPALVLLLCSVDAIGSYYGSKNGKAILKKDIDKVMSSPGASKDHFSSFFKIEEVVCVVGSLSDGDISVLYEQYRCKAAHNASLGKNTFIGIYGNSTLISTVGPQTKIDLQVLLQAVKEGFDRLCRDVNPKHGKEMEHPAGVPETGLTETVVTVIV